MSADATQPAVVRGHREPDAARPREHGGRDADHRAARVDERPAGVAGVHRRVGLDEPLEHLAARAPARFRCSADTTPIDTDRSKPSGFPIATTNSPTRSRRSASAQRGQVARVGAHDREIGARVRADELAAHDARARRAGRAAVRRPRRRGRS